MKTIMFLLISLCILVFPKTSYAVTYVPTADGSTLSVSDLEYPGTSVTVLGDIDGDYYTNIAIGAPRYNSSGGIGAIYFPSTGAEGFKSSVDLATIGTTSPGLWLTGSMPPSAIGSYIGDNVVSLGDLDGDKINDSAFTRKGTSAVEIFYGSKSLSGIRNLNALASITRVIEIKDIPVNFVPIAIMSGDFIGDSKKELVISYGQSGEIVVIDASKITPGSYTLASLIDGVKGWKFKINYSSVSTDRIALIDTTRSGKKDIVAVNSTGNVIIIHNKATYPTSSIIDDAWLAANSGTKIPTSTNFNIMSIYDVGDINCDNIDDILMRGNNNSVRVEYGRSTWPTIVDLTSELSDATNGMVIKNLGAANHDLVNVSRAGDRNGDGCKDFMIGDYTFSYDNNPNSGRVIYFNSRPGIGWGTSFDMFNMESAFGEQYFGTRKAFFGASVTYAENLLGGFGCSADASIVASEPGYGNLQGKVYVIPVKK